MLLYKEQDIILWEFCIVYKANIYISINAFQNHIAHSAELNPQVNNLPTYVGIGYSIQCTYHALEGLPYTNNGTLVFISIYKKTNFSCPLYICIYELDINLWPMRRHSGIKLLPVFYQNQSCTNLFIHKDESWQAYSSVFSKGQWLNEYMRVMSGI